MAQHLRLRSRYFCNAIKPVPVPTTGGILRDQGQPQGIAPTEDRILCFRGKSFRAAKTFASEGNPLWLPLTAMGFRFTRIGIYRYYFNIFGMQMFEIVICCH